ncbi:thiamine biosynthesis lipoprotein [Roseovarius sp. MBR-78]|jgi:thiamine biosynthesis lipoprotein|uniref:FAD:protein FMN transferase n=1 Tax=Roseovarius sp. MBR-78 TaxID=3156460 RepID=UPI0033959075
MTLTRRRFLSISAAALSVPAAAQAGESARWQGVALGAPASMVLAGVTPPAARPVFAALEAEVLRLERIFSLYRDDSALARLNAQGHLDAPPPEMLDLLSLAGAIHDATGGAFDPTVQPLWRARATGGDEAAARGLIGWQGVRFDAQTVTLARPGMALTLNGIAQGYITDRIADLLRSRGFGDVLVDMGEVVARGRRGDGAAWQAGIAAPDGALVGRVTLRDRALATSAPMGTRLVGGRGHIIDPVGGQARRTLVSVSAPRAAVADGLSTALCLVDDVTAERAVARFAGARIEALA